MFNPGPFARAWGRPRRRPRKTPALVAAAAFLLLARDAAAVDDRAEPARAGPIAATARGELALGGGVDVRRFEYRNGISPSPYQSSVLWTAVSVSGLLFPFPASLGALRDVGITAEGAMLFASGGVDTDPISYSGGLVARVHPGADPRVILTPSIAYAFASFGSAGPATAELPAVRYRALRPAIDARWQSGDFAVLGGTALRLVLDPSHVSSEFYGPQGLGLDAHLGLAFMVLRRLELRLVGSYQMFSFGFRAPPGSLFDSGGAVDLLYGVALSVARAF
ncbi:MAG: hypothetical protein JOZ69_15750 [Myxococcales bacterium]|nr:hypothetical protein [Myxococcales bacterium]